MIGPFEDICLGQRENSKKVNYSIKVVIKVSAETGSTRKLAEKIHWTSERNERMKNKR